MCGIIHPHRQVDAVALYNDVAILRLDEPLQVSISPTFYEQLKKVFWAAFLSFFLAL